MKEKWYENKNTMKTLTIRMKLKIALVFALVLIIPIAMSSCKRGRAEEVTPNDSIVEEEVVDVNYRDSIRVNVYIENSGSMDGFVKGVTNFKSDIGNLLADLKYYYDENNIKLYFIHNDSHENLKMAEASSGKDLADVAQWIGVEWKKEPRGSNTKLNNIFRTILDRTDKSTVSILISDCIYSIGKEGNTIDLLDHEKTTTKDAFLSRSKNGNMNIATSIYRMTSAFNGKYYPYIGDAYSYQYCDPLPYYICVFAEESVMSDFCSKVEISEKDYKGYSNRYIIARGMSKEPYWTVLPLTNNKGRFQKIRDRNKVVVHGIEGVERDRNGLFSFCVAVDMSGVNVEDDYLLDISNYIIDNSKYVINSVLPIAKMDINKSDMNMLKKNSTMPTHIIIIENTNLDFCDLGIALKKKMPQWIDQYNIMDDTSPNMLKNGGSFGLRYWIEGISRAYETLYPQDTNYFSFIIKIKK